MDPRPLLINLETPYSEYSGAAPLKDVLLAGLRWETQYWAGLAVSWIEQGAPIDKEIKEELDHISEKKHFPQSVRHKAFALARRWERANA